MQSTRTLKGFTFHQLYLIWDAYMQLFEDETSLTQRRREQKEGAYTEQKDKERENSLVKW